jgi:hypothetical protein
MNRTARIISPPGIGNRNVRETRVTLKWSGELRGVCISMQLSRHDDSANMREELHDGVRKDFSGGTEKTPRHRRREFRSASSKVFKYREVE